MHAALSSLIFPLGCRLKQRTWAEAMAKFPGFTGIAHVAGHGVTVTPSTCCSCHFEIRPPKILTTLMSRSVKSMDSMTFTTWEFQDQYYEPAGPYVPPSEQSGTQFNFGYCSRHLCQNMPIIYPYFLINVWENLVL